MTKDKKLKVSLFRAFLGYFGVDAFVMGKLGQAITRLVMGVVLIGLVALLVVLSIINVEQTGFILGVIAVAAVVVIRLFLYFLGGMLMLKKSEEDVIEMYK